MRKFFYYLAELLTMPLIFLIGIKTSIFHAQAFVENYQKQIQDFLQFQLASDLFIEFDKLEYVNLVEMKAVA